MNTQQIATRLTELCRQGQFEAAQKELFAEDAVSIEPHETPDFPKETKGLRAIIEKGHKFGSMVRLPISVGSIFSTRESASIAASLRIGRSTV